MRQMSPMRVHEWLIDSFNFWLSAKELPKYILRSQSFLIPKGVYNEDPSNTRPIHLIEVPRKLFATIITMKLVTIIEKNNILKGINLGSGQKWELLIFFI